MDELSSQGEMGYKDDDAKPISKTLNHEEAKLEKIEYVKKEFERYHEIEVVEKDTITTLNKTRRRDRLD